MDEQELKTQTEERRKTLLFAYLFIQENWPEPAAGQDLEIEIRGAVNLDAVAEKVSKLVCKLDAVERNRYDERMNDREAMLIRGRSIEGSLDIMWMNRGTSATPRYNLFFLPYASPRNGAQKPHDLVGDEELKDYLVKLGFKPADAEYWVEVVRSQERAASIPNVWMPEWRQADFEPPKAAGA